MIASAGGHWQQLMLLREAFEGREVQYATTLAGLARQSGLASAHLVPDCNRNARLAILRSTTKIVLLMLRLRPAIVITTGALPGLIALAVGRRLGARTVWVDSIANAEEMSLAGMKARAHADLWLSQWPQVARASGADYAGSVL
jgi:hypothetical protein